MSDILKICPKCCFSKELPSGLSLSIDDITAVQTIHRIFLLHIPSEKADPS
jgi:hypothetical protein